jgi:hypothetical protein
MATMITTELDEFFRESRRRINQIARGELRDRMETQHLGEGIYVGVRKDASPWEYVPPAGPPPHET